MGNDITLLKSIVFYCGQIEKMIKRFGEEEYDFMSDDAYQYTVSFCISQIGEAINRLSAELTEKYPEVHWRGIYGMRNIISHAYSDIDLEKIWNTTIEEIPMLKETCEKILRELRPQKPSAL